MTTRKQDSISDSESVPDAQAKFVVIGYGNPSHGDASMSWEVVQRLKALNIANLEVNSVKQLTPELSDKLAIANYAFFVDACYVKGPDHVQITSLEARGSETTGSGVPALGHSCDPSSLLALTCSVYGHCPKAWGIAIPAHDFIEGHQRSDLAEEVIDQAIEAIQTLMKTVARPHAKAGDRT
jgi:Ni,Fe-hydrogenase maturation factor